jgi:hypothetical protein
MNRENVKDTPKARSSIGDTASKQEELKFDKPLGSSHDDKVDLRDVARKAAKKSR